MSEKPNLVKNSKVKKLYRGSPTVRKVLEKALSQCADIKKVIIITKNADGYIGVGWSNTLLNSEAVGLLEYAKTEVIDIMKGK